MSQKVAVQYGLFGGEHIGRRLRAALRQEGYTPVRSVSDADIVICHSAGCFWLPSAPSHQKFMLVGPPYWPGKTARARILERTSHNLRPGAQGYSIWRWLARNLWGVYYAVFDLPRNIRVLAYGSRYDLRAAIAGHRTLLVRNQADGWLTPDLDHLRVINPTIKIVEMPGDHGDIIHNPERYVRLLKHL
jgi:hypothetical protein